MIAIVNPEAMYRAATAKPNIPNSNTTATSLTSGEAIRNDSVTPSGTPAETNPMNAGTAEHEQNGVATPSVAASTLPTPSRLPPSSDRVRSTDMNERSTATAKMIPANSSAIFERVIEEEPQRLAQAGVQIQAEHAAQNPIPHRRERFDRGQPHECTERQRRFRVAPGEGDRSRSGGLSAGC